MKGLTIRRPYRRIPLADQLRRRRELDEIRMVRAFTPAERAEDDDLAERAYQRAYRQTYAELPRVASARR